MAGDSTLHTVYLERTHEVWVAVTTSLCIYTGLRPSRSELSVAALRFVREANTRGRSVCLLHVVVGAVSSARAYAMTC